MTASSASLLVDYGSFTIPSARVKDSQTTYWGWCLLVAIAMCSAVAIHQGFIWWMTAITILGFIAAAVGLVRPALGLFGISLLCALDSVNRQFLFDGTIPYLRFNTLNYWLLIVMAGHQALIRRLNDTQTRLIIAFVALLTVEMVFSERISRGAQHVLGIATMFGLIVYFVRAAARTRAWYWQGVLSGGAGALGGLIYNLDGNMPALNHNVYALFPETAIFALCLAFGFADNTREEFVLVALAAINMVWVFLSGSRGGLMISFAAVLFLILAMKGGGKKLLYIAAAAAVVVVVSSRFTDLKEQSMARFEKLWSAEESADGRTSGRTSLALGGWHIFLEHPLGVGTGGSELAWARLGYVEGISDLKAGQEFSLHSGWIKVLAENGLPGILLFVAVVASFAVVGWKTEEPFLRALGIAVTLTLAVAFLSTEFQGKAFWFLSAGALTVLNREPMLAALRGGRRKRVWWVRPALPRQALRPRVVGSEQSRPVAKVPRKPRPLL
jgi:hypothetical protein